MLIVSLSFLFELKKRLRLQQPPDRISPVRSFKSAYWPMCAMIGPAKLSLNSTWWVIQTIILYYYNEYRVVLLWQCVGLIFTQPCLTSALQEGVCCNPVPTTTVPPTTAPPTTAPPTTPPPTTTTPIPYVTCSAVQECVPNQVCNNRPGQELTNFNAVSVALYSHIGVRFFNWFDVLIVKNCQTPFGQIGVCCNPVPTTTTTTTTTTTPIPYVTCSAVQECVSTQVCNNRPGQELTNFNAVSDALYSFIGIRLF